MPDWCHFRPPRQNQARIAEFATKVGDTEEMAHGTAAQIRAARALLNWRLSTLADTAGVSEAAVRSAERDGRSVRGATLRAILLALEEAGVTFIEAGEASPSAGPGARLRQRAS